ncbi:MAG TPA: hypothetical protein VFG89_07840 [Coriobacteriia bacterium]|nr:hypothetical protein [Coriobacteriia bacterium]
MSWIWVAGAALAALCSVACGVNIGARVSSGKEPVWSPQVLIWVVGFHGAAGVAALMMLVQSRG